MEIVIYPNPVLEQKTTKIKDPMNKEIQDLIPQMIEAMRKNNGMGLAAPQIGKSIRLCVIEENKQLYVMINPKITSLSKETDISEEGCLSFPGKFLPNIKRSEKVTALYLDEKGKRCKIKAKGLLARAIQHEIDHLNGILFTQRSL